MFSHYMVLVFCFLVCFGDLFHRAGLSLPLHIFDGMKMWKALNS